MGVNSIGERQWEIYCDNEELAKLLPGSYGGNDIHVIIALRPTQKDIEEAKRREKEAEERESRRWLKNIWSPKNKKKKRN